MTILEELFPEVFKNVNPVIQWAIVVVGALIILVGIISIIVAIALAIKYVKYNRRMNSRNLTGKDAARKVLDDNGLQHIKVSVVGSLLFGNSYSHYFKKVRIRRLTNKKPSITSLAIGVQKSALAIMDKEGDKDMKTRIVLTPLMYFGPFAFVPLIVIGVALDIILFNFTGVVSLIAVIAGLGIYVVSFLLSLFTLKTEVKAQAKAIEIMKKENLATDEEIEMMKELYKLYNIQYVNDLILELLQIIFKILTFIARMQNSSSVSTGD